MFHEAIETGQLVTDMLTCDKPLGKLQWHSL